MNWLGVIFAVFLCVFLVVVVGIWFYRSRLLIDTVIYDRLVSVKGGGLLNDAGVFGLGVNVFPDKVTGQFVHRSASQEVYGTINKVVSAKNNVIVLAGETSSNQPMQITFQKPDSVTVNVGMDRESNVVDTTMTQNAYLEIVRS
jgi:hypothetical protein